MVDAVQPSNMAKLRLLSGQSESASRAAPNAAPGDKPIKANDAVKLSDTASMRLAGEMVQKGPPFDVEKVTRIKDAIAGGQYPVDFHRLSESIFQDYSAMMR